MGSSAGRRSAAYKAFGAELKRTRPPCCLATGPWCTGVGLTVEHDPPISGYPDESAWRRAGGRWRGACKPCQDRQGAAIRNGKDVDPWNW